MTPNKENIRKWVDALRSGDYKQGQGGLREADRYCCLGVACDVSGLGEWELTDAVEDAAWFRYRDGAWSSSTDVLPSSVQEWLGLDADPGVGESHLSKLNDVNELSFAEIADLIEAEYLDGEQ